MNEPEQGSAEAVYISAMVGEMMRRVLEDALAELARTRGAAFLEIFVARELARCADLFRERPGDTPETTDMLRAWFAMEGGAARGGRSRQRRGGARLRHSAVVPAAGRGPVQAVRARRQFRANCSPSSWAKLRLGNVETAITAEDKEIGVTAGETSRARQAFRHP